MYIVERALATTDVRIEWQVNERIAELAGGFPNPVHVIGSEAFEVDGDDLIDDADLEIAIEGVVTEKWKEQFDADYVKAGSGKYRNIIKAMATYDEVEVPSSYICEMLKVKQPEISSNINDLMRRDVIVRTDRGCTGSRTRCSGSTSGCSICRGRNRSSIGRACGPLARV